MSPVAVRNDGRAWVSGGGGAWVSGAGTGITAPANVQVLADTAFPSGYQMGPNSAFVRWNPSTVSTGELLDHYEIQYSSDGGVTWSQTVAVSPVNYGIVGGGASTNAVPAQYPLSPSTNYKFRVRCVDENNNVSPWGASATSYPTPASGPNWPEAPRTLINTRFNAPSVYATVTDYASLQNAINNAPINSTILLAHGSTFDVGGNVLTLPNKSGNGWIYIMTDDYAGLSAIAPPGTRVNNTTCLAHMPIITSSANNVTIGTVNGSHQYRFVGCQIAVSQYTDRLVGLNEQQATSNSNQTTDVVFDRCYIAGQPTIGNVKHAVDIDGARNAVIDSYFRYIWLNGNGDTQCIYGFSGLGPYKIKNNWLNGGGEIILFGGADPYIAGNNNADIVTLDNTFYRDPADFTNPNFYTKNVHEVKKGVRMLVAHNTWINAWFGGQTTAVAYEVRNQGGTDATGLVADIMHINNWLGNCVGGGLQIQSQDGPGGGSGYTQVSKRLCFYNNVWQLQPSGAQSPPIGDTNQAIRIDSPGNAIPAYGGPPEDFIYMHNTAINPQTGSASGWLFTVSHTSLGPDPYKWTNFMIANNVFDPFVYFSLPILGDSLSTRLSDVCVNPVCKSNAWVGTDITGAPAGNYGQALVPNDAAVKFNAYPALNNGTFPTGANYGLQAGSPLKGIATDGTDIGVDQTLIQTV